MEMTNSALGLSSINLDSTAKRRDPAPLNVYVRIRPFIGDELERGEDQHLLDIIDDQHIGVKLYPTIAHTTRAQQASFNEYAVTKIFDHRCTQHHLFEQVLQEPTEDIFNGNNWLFSTLGLTNSGKTHTMFGNAEEPGLLPKCLDRIFAHVGTNIDKKLLFKPDGLENLISTENSTLDTEIRVRNYIFADERRRARLRNYVQPQDSLQDLSADADQYSVWMSFFELYNENIFDLLVQPKQMKTRKNLRLMQNEHSTIIKNLIQIPVFDQHEAEDIIKFGFANRATSKTNLNEASSRSHAILCITLITINEFKDEPTLSHMYICDLAGNEPSMGTGKQLMETCNINTSLMTFKDCIRVLNENHTSKKHMLVPYRNSVLTSIFRPFFIGRGRTIICCNVNPCAAFINQTNDLLKFCALAQKTVIVPTEGKHGGVIRVQRKSKNKGPKRLARESLLRKKKEKNPSHDECSVTFAENETQMTNDSLFKVPTDIKSIDYWKYTTKKALALLQKQAANRRLLLMQRHEEQVKTVQYLLSQRQQIARLTDDYQRICQQKETLKENLRDEQDAHLHTQQLYADLIQSEKQLRKKLHQFEKQNREEHVLSHDQIDTLKIQLKHLQEKFDRLTEEHQGTIQEFRRYKSEEKGREQYLHDEIQRLKRDLGLELYRKQDAEKKARAYEEKLRQEQLEYQKMQYDFTKSKHEFNTLQVKYDALQLEIGEMNRKPKIHPIIMLDDRTSITTINEDQSQSMGEKRSVRSKRRTDEEIHRDQEIKKLKRSTGDQSIVSTDTGSVNVHYAEIGVNEKRSKRIPRQISNSSVNKTVPISIKRTKKKSSETSEKDQIDSKGKSKATTSRTRAKKKSIPSPVKPVERESNSPIYATIQRTRPSDQDSVGTVAIRTDLVQTPQAQPQSQLTPKPSTFKRIQSFFRATPTLTSSARMTRVAQVKTTTVAFGSSTPTNRAPPTIIKTPGVTVPPPVVSTGSVVKTTTPKSKYNLRTRIFHNPAPSEKEKDNDEMKSRAKKPLRTRK